MEVYQDTDDMILPEGFEPGASVFEEEKPFEETPTTETEEEVIEETDEDQEDSQVEETEESAEEESGDEPTTAQEEETEQPQKVKIKVKFNHQDLELDEDEAAPLIQKGMNYEKVVAKAQEAESKQFKAENLAKMMGFESAEQMLEAAENNYVQNIIEQKVADMVEQGVAEPVARDIANRDPEVVKIQEMRKVKPEPVVVQPEVNERDSDLDDFVRTNPGVTKLPPEVIEAVAKGQKLTVAYEQYKVKQAKAEKDKAERELKILKQNQSSASKAPVASVTKTGSTKAKSKDAFDMGFDSE